MRNIRLQVPTSVSAACHYAAQIAGCSVQEAYGAVLFHAISGHDQEDVAGMVTAALAKYRAALTIDYSISAKKGT